MINIYGWVPVWLPDRKVAMPTDYDIDSIMQYTNITSGTILKKDYMGRKKDAKLNTYEISERDVKTVRNLYFR